MSFWSILVSADKPHTFTPVFDLKITQLVLPAAATHKDRTVVECTFDDQTFAVGSLKLDVQENIATDLLIEEGKPVTFATKGSNPVQVTGYYVVDQEDDFDDLSDDDDIEGFEGFEGEEGEEEEEEEDDPEVNEEFLKQATLQALNNKRKQPQGQQNGAQNGAKKVKIADGEAKPQEQKEKQENTPQQPEQKEKPEKPQQPKAQNQKQQKQKQQQQQQQQKPEQKPEQAKEKEEAKVEASEPAVEQQKQGGEQKQKQGGEQKQKGEQKQQKGNKQQGTPKQNKQQQQQQKAQTPKAENSPAQKESKGGAEQETKMISGMKVIITKPGQGSAEAKRGESVRVMYVGRLATGKVFDQSEGPFEFRLGKGQVIRGWDLGVEGMRIGEQRTLIIPPELAYGSKGMPPVIPKNATLRFDVKMVKF